MKKVWHFTIEQDIPIMAYDEEEAEKEFYKRYGNIPILGIIRPLSENNSLRPSKNGDDNVE